MATTTTRPTSSSSRRSSSSFNAPTATSIARGATARSAVSPKVNASLNGINRRGSVTRTPVQPIQDASSSTGHEGLLDALKKEAEEKEELLVRIQDKDQSIRELTTENANFTTALNAAETRLNELYADQARVEEETVARLELIDRLRAQVQELEREKRDIYRRYNEQTATFDAERQSFYDNEQHLKSRIQSLVRARKTSELSHKAPVNQGSVGNEIPVKEEFTEEPQSTTDYAQPTQQESTKADNNDDEPAEMTSLRLELSTLSTSYASLQNTVQHLSSQLLDLKRVNNHLQEENESYNILLRERTLNGQFDILRTVGAGDIEEDSLEVADEAAYYGNEDETSLRSMDRTPLDPVEELAEDMDSAVYGQGSQRMDLDDNESLSSVDTRERSRGMGRKGRRAAKSSRSPPPKGESLAGLPVAGPGLDLAAELGRAENQAYVEGEANAPDSRDRAVVKQGKKKIIDRKSSFTQAPSSSPGGDIDALRNEVKSLKDANKALSLYASKIIDRIIAQEGFEHVLAVDYEKPPSSPAKKVVPPAPKIEQVPSKKARPQSAIFGLNFQSSEPTSQSSEAPKSPVPPTPVTAVPIESSATTKTQRRSMSFDWRPFSMFSGSTEKKPEANPSLKPLNLRPGAPTVVNARKLDTQEDEEDRKERERLNAVMKLMGIEKAATTVPPSPFMSSTPSGDNASGMSTPSEVTSPKPAATSRFSFFRSRSNTSETSVVSVNSAQANTGQKPSLTAETLERADAETSLAALDERERTLSAEIAKGANGGFTELPSRRQRGEEWRSRRSKRSGGSGSGSTVWSAGMSTHREEDSADEAAHAQ